MRRSVYRAPGRAHQQQIYCLQKRRLRDSAGKKGIKRFGQPAADLIFFAFSICVSGSAPPPVYCSPDASMVKRENSIVSSIHALRRGVPNGTQVLVRHKSRESPCYQQAQLCSAPKNPRVGDALRKH
jgi:hypothetical protein